VTPEEREAHTAAFWQKALAGADPEHWEVILRNATPASTSVRMIYGFTNDELDLAQARLDDPDPQVGEGGGRLERYEIGQRVNHRTHCLRCGDPLTAKRAAKYCTKKCRQRQPALPERPCQNCGQPLQPQRSTGRFHKECRQRAYRVEHANIDT
jgi:hypothetical protein